MTLEILQEELAHGLSLVSRVVATKGQLPVLANVLLEAETDGLSIVATNLELGLRVRVGGKVSEPGSITIPARQLAEFISALKGGSVLLTTKDEKLDIQAGRYKGSFAGISASEFPVVTKLPSDGVVEVKKDIFTTAATQVAFSAATDESRPVLTGVRFMVRDSQLVLMATDGFRLSRHTVPLTGAGERLHSLILPARTLFELARLFPEGRKDSVAVYVSEGSNQVVFGYDKVELTSRVLEGNFPDVERIIPSEYKTTVSIDVEPLLQAVRAASIFARENNNIIRFAIRNSVFEIQATGGQTGESRVELEAETTGEEMEIAFNFRYVLDFLTNAHIERLTLLLSGPLAPGVWKSEAESGMLHVIMPVRL